MMTMSRMVSMSRNRPFLGVSPRYPPGARTRPSRPIEAIDVRVRRGSRTVLDGVGLALEAGEAAARSRRARLPLGGRRQRAGPGGPRHAERHAEPRDAATDRPA